MGNFSRTFADHRASQLTEVPVTVMFRNGFRLKC